MATRNRKERRAKERLKTAEEQAAKSVDLAARLANIQLLVKRQEEELEQLRPLREVHRELTLVRRSYDETKGHYARLGQSHEEQFRKIVKQERELKMLKEQVDALEADHGIKTIKKLRKRLEEKTLELTTLRTTVNGLKIGERHANIL